MDKRDIFAVNAKIYLFIQGMSQKETFLLQFLPRVPLWQAKDLWLVHCPTSTPLTFEQPWW